MQRALTSYPSVVFSLGRTFESLKEIENASFLFIYLFVFLCVCFEFCSCVCVVVKEDNMNNKKGGTIQGSIRNDESFET
jgi:hypothetical protein